jgi:hypothetical protein
MTQTTTSDRKADAARRNIALANAANAARYSFGVWKCATCQSEAPATVHQLRKTYCSKACMAAGYRVRFAGAGNNNHSNAGWKVCRACGKDFHNYNRRSRYCSIACRPLPRQIGGDMTRYKTCSKDANHKPICDALIEFGASVIDVSNAKVPGLPDLIVGWAEETLLMEIKNPKTAYGKAGLNKNQKKWRDHWLGGTYCVVYDIEGALRAVRMLACK